MPIDPAVQQGNCIDWDVRLQNGSNELQGRVEVCYNDAWGTICQNRFSGEEAQIVCQQLGFLTEGKIIIIIIIQQSQVQWMNEITLYTLYRC